MANIRMIPPDEATGFLKEVYDKIKGSRGKIAQVHMLHSLNPQSLAVHMNLYQTLLFGKSPLKRWQREMLAVVASAENQCAYCIRHHSEALLHFWKDPQRVEQLQKDYTKAGLEESDILLCRLATQLTRSPSSEEVKNIIVKIREAEFSDRAILDAHLIISYFNFVNRLVLGLNINIEQDPGGYVYD